MVNNLFVLFESAEGLALFRISEAEEISVQALTKSVQNFNVFNNMCSMEAFVPFTDQEQALECISQLSESSLPETLVEFLKTSLPDISKKKMRKNITLGVSDPLLGTQIKQALEIDCRCDEIILELSRGIRNHFDEYTKSQYESKKIDSRVARVGLGNNYSRMRVKFNVSRTDNMIIQAIAMLDYVDKDLNSYCMRCKEWYGWHFPELTKLIGDQILYVQLVDIIGDKKCITTSDSAAVEKVKKELTNASNDPNLTETIVIAAKSSMGSDISAVDILNIRSFAKRVASLFKFRSSLHQYLCSRMDSCAPNLTALMGEQVGARLISKAGSLVKLAKYPASTLQILGAEKALFRALKSKGKCNTPKYGLIFNSSFITRALAKNKGRISRYLSNKAAMACRLDCFLDNPTNRYGLAFKEQVEQRLQFFKTGKLPDTNNAIMDKVRQGLIDDPEPEDKEMIDGTETKTKQQGKKRSLTEAESDDNEDEEEEKEKKPPASKAKAAPSKDVRMDEASSSGEESDDEAEQPKQKQTQKPQKPQKQSQKTSEESSADESNDEDSDNEEELKEKLKKEMEAKLKKEMEEKLKKEMEKLSVQKKSSKKKKKQSQ